MIRRFDKNAELKTADSSIVKIKFFVYLKLAYGLFRDVLCIVGLILIDICILIQFRKILGRKKKFFTKESGHGKPNARIDSVENRITKLVLISGTVNALGHVPYFLKLLPWIEMSQCLKDGTTTVFFLSLCSQFFINYFFNKNFSRYFNRKFRTLFMNPCQKEPENKSQATYASQWRENS